ncbi:hypothetical protein Tco_1405185 [Tanacetum coccineum]
MDHGLNGHCLKGLCPWDRRPPTRYISRLWAAITIQEYTRNWKDKKTHPVDCRATSPTRQERDSLKSQGRGWPRGPTWRLGISAGNAKWYGIKSNPSCMVNKQRDQVRIELRMTELSSLPLVGLLAKTDAPPTTLYGLVSKATEYSYLLCSIDSSAHSTYDSYPIASSYSLSAGVKDRSNSSSALLVASSQLSLKRWFARAIVRILSTMSTESSTRNHFLDILEKIKQFRVSKLMVVTVGSSPKCIKTLGSTIPRPALGCVKPRADTNKSVPLIPPNTEPPKGRPVPTSKIDTRATILETIFLDRSPIQRIRPTSSLFSFMAEISPHQGTKSQWRNQITMDRTTGNDNRMHSRKMARGKDKIYFDQTCSESFCRFGGSSRSFTSTIRSNKAFCAGSSGSSGESYRSYSAIGTESYAGESDAGNSHSCTNKTEKEEHYIMYVACQPALSNKPTNSGPVQPMLHKGQVQRNGTTPPIEKRKDLQGLFLLLHWIEFTYAFPSSSQGFGTFDKKLPHWLARLNYGSEALTFYLSQELIPTYLCSNRNFLFLLERSPLFGHLLGLLYKIDKIEAKQLLQTGLRGSERNAVGMFELSKSTTSLRCVGEVSWLFRARAKRARSDPSWKNYRSAFLSFHQERHLWTSASTSSRGTMDQDFWFPFSFQLRSLLLLEGYGFLSPGSRLIGSATLSIKAIKAFIHTHFAPLTPERKLAHLSDWIRS